MSNKHGRTCQRTKDLTDELISRRTRSCNKGFVYHCANRMVKEYIKGYFYQLRKTFPLSMPQSRLF